MEKNTSIVVYYSYQKNKIIEDRIREYYPQVKVTAIRDDDHKRILRYSEGNRVWYRLWINPEDMMRIEPLLEGGDRIWMEELEMYYTFFYEINNGRRVLGKDRIKKILDTIL